MATRAKSAAATIETAPSEEREPITVKTPMLLRLQPRTLFRDEDRERLQPRLGATLTVQSRWHSDNNEAFEIWLPAVMWEGLATIICQTPRHHREGVAEVFQLIDSALGTEESALGGLIRELIDEIRNDPYADIPEDSPSEFDLNW